MHPTIQTEKTPTSALPRPNSAPAYYLGRPANFWLAVSTCFTGAQDAWLLGHLDLDR